MKCIFTDLSEAFFAKSTYSTMYRFSIKIGLQTMEGHMNFDEVTEKTLAFREERDWTQFHNPKDLAISISLEAAELLEVFQWSGQDVVVESKSEKIKEEIADVVIYCIYLADTLGLNLADVISSKLDENAKRYPAEKAKGNARKYTEL